MYARTIPQLFAPAIPVAVGCWLFLAKAAAPGGNAAEVLAANRRLFSWSAAVATVGRELPCLDHPEQSAAYTTGAASAHGGTRACSSALHMEQATC